MNPSTLTMDPAQAREKAAAYKRQLSKRSDPEYSAAAEIYDLLARGRTVIDVGIAIREGGFDELMRPKLAIARADRAQVRFSWNHANDTAIFDSSKKGWADEPTLLERVNFNRRHGRTTPPNSTGQSWGITIEAFALVPMIPADVRPPGDARQWHILWEVEQWADKRIGAQPPTDPYLLRRIHGDTFEVLAEWDLTEVEKYVMAGRARLQL